MQKDPAFMELTPALVDGVSANRLMVALRTSGCAYARSASSGCTFCGFIELTTKGQPVSDEDILDQFYTTVESYDFFRENIAEIDIYNSGSFLSDSEISPFVRQQIFRKIKELPVRKVFIESRPEFIIKNKAELEKLRGIIGDRVLEIGIGLETANDSLRLEKMNKGFTFADFRTAAEILSELEIDLLAYVFLKPPSLTEAQAIADSVDTVKQLSLMAAKMPLKIKIALQPAFVARGTVIEKLYLDGLYRPPRIWSVIEVIKRVLPFNIPLQIGLSDEGLSAGRTVFNCQKCSLVLFDALRRFNSGAGIEELTGIECDCKADWFKLMESSVPEQ